ncbi:MAG: hypothetical protein ACREFR_19905 [Limisphaerales bacterium]
MKNVASRVHQLLLSLVLALIPAGALAQANNIIFGPEGSEASIDNPDGTWINMWGPAFVSTTFDPANPPPTGDTQGSVYNQGNWTGDTNGWDDYNMVSPETAWDSTTFDGSKYSSIQFDVKYDTTSTMTPTSAAHLAIGFDTGYAIVTMTNLSFDTASSGLADGNWHHVIVPVTEAAFTGAGKDPTTCDGVAYYQWNPAGTSGTMNFWMANVVLLANTTPAPPPTMSISKAVPALHFVEGSISGQYDRQNIITANGANSSANYSWAGVASAQNPVTYSATISQFAAPDLNYHIYIYQTAGAGSASAPDYNQPTVAMLQITPTANNTEAVAQILWKTNMPDASVTNIALNVTNSLLTGTWGLQFTSDTGGNVIAPGGNTYPFTIDPGVAANLSNPVTVNFGINPSTDSPSIIGEEVLVSQASISGVSPLSANYNTTDNFLGDTVLDTNTWTVNALDPASIWFVATNDVYSVNWTVPDSGYSLVESSSLSNLGQAIGPGLPTASLTPGKRTLVPQSSLSGTAGFFALVQRSAYQLQVLMPGETNAPFTTTGKVGSPTPQSVNSETMVTINMCDQNWNIVSSSDMIHLTSSDGGADLPNDAELVSGTLTEGMFFGTEPANSTVTASDDTNPSILSNTSSSVSVGP